MLLNKTDSIIAFGYTKIQSNTSESSLFIPLIFTDTSIQFTTHTYISV